MPEAKGGVTYRSIVLGLALIPFTCLWIALAEMVWYSGQPTTLSLFYHVVFILFVLVVGNMGLARLKPAWAFAPGELLVVYTMLCLASALAGHDFLQVLLPSLTTLHRYGPLEGRYGEIIEHAPRWLLVTDETALDSAYIGQESIYRWSNLRGWIEPAGWWLLFILALASVMWALNLLFRKQWTEHEKLSYPVLQTPLHLATLPGVLFRSRAFWIAFGIAGGLDLLNGLHVLYPVFPEVPIVHILNIQELFSERPWTDMGFAWVSFYPFAMGMCFFMPLDLAFSCWFFFLFWKAQKVLASYVGVHGMPGFPFVEEQTAGGYYAVALIALWISRRRLLEAVRLLLGKSGPDADPWERQEARLALFLAAAGGSFLLLFSVKAGMTPWLVVLFFSGYYLISLAITRMRAELGPPVHDLHWIGPQLQLVKLFGMANMFQRHPRDLAMFGLFSTFNRAYRGHPMPHGMEGYRIAERLGLSNRRYTAAMLLALAFGAVCGVWAILWACNKYGLAAGMIVGEGFGRETWDKANIWFTAPEPHTYGPAWAIAIGTLFCFGLAALRMALTWWPLHPVGYAISGSWSMEQIWLCVFLAWLIKALLLKYGGPRAYRPAVPFFLGLVLGDFMVGSFWNIYGIVMETQVYHFWPY